MAVDPVVTVIADGNVSAAWAVGHTLTPPDDGFRERVHRGALRLDQARPGWWQPDRIDLDRLDMAMNTDDVLGQLDGHYKDGCHLLGLLPYGIESDFLGFSEFWVRDYPALTVAWRQLIIARRASAAA